ncbi:SymE family type I addiction module toxin [Pectobacterium carotovorum]|uniref:SymE family type I addiction module toxin n=1 Tax=Pectobacterium carotovorum TaxID=554 RepID=UPI00381997A7|nr:type I toxin-antitoxin system SymE family toxin [Pectobacterium carotovorum]
MAHYPAQDCSADHEPEGADWVGDDGTLTLAGDWLTQSGLLGQPLRIDVLPGKITL